MSNTADALLQAGSIRDQIEKMSPESAAHAKDAIADFQKKLDSLTGTGGGFLAPPSQEVTLSRTNGSVGTLYQQIWGVDAEPTAAQAEAMAAADRESNDVLKRWNEFKTKELPAMNRMLRDAQVPEIKIHSDFKQEDVEIDVE